MLIEDLLDEIATEEADKKVLAENPGLLSGDHKVPITYWVPLEEMTKQQLIDYIMQNRSGA